MAKWIAFEEEPVRDGRVTREWRVVAKQSGNVLGVVRWYTGWRRYVFAPEWGSEYEQDCLRDIASFIERETRERKAQREGTFDGSSGVTT